MEYGSHLQWCFDVWEHEPNIDKKMLEKACIATPHIAGYSVQSKIRGIDMIYKIACDTRLIEEKPIMPIAMPKQRLTFSGQHSWQDIVLGVFNPMIITTMMRALLLPDENHGDCFDEMRNQFNYRHELAYSHVTEATVSTEDAALLAKLGVKMN
jgi:erythronate-4-phosphate dehydrogenase